MARWTKWLLFCVLCCGVALAALQVYVSRHGAQIFSQKIAEITHRKSTIGTVSLIWLPGLAARKLVVEELLTAEQVRVQFDLGALLHGRLVFHTIEIDEAQGYVDLSPSSLPVTDVLADPVLSSAVIRQGASFDNLRIRNSRLRLRNIFGQDVLLTRIEAEVGPVHFDETPVRTELVMSASLEEVDLPFVGNLIKARGWLNWADKDMDVRVEAVDDNGRVGLSAVLRSVHNDLTIEGTFRITGGQQVQALGRRTGMMEEAVIGLLEATSTDVETHFVFQTKMDHFEPGPVALSGNITTGLNSEGSSGNIVQSLKALGEQLLQKSAPGSGSPNN